MTNIEIEKTVMKMLLKSNNNAMQLLKSQYEFSTISNIEETGCGIYFSYDQKNYKGEKFKLDFQFGDINIGGPDIEDGAGAIVFVENGFLKTLEIYSYGDEWPSTISNIVVSYSGEHRDFSRVEAAIK